jgi:hypothetical protein
LYCEHPLEGEHTALGLAGCDRHNTEQVVEFGVAGAGGADRADA